MEKKALLYCDDNTDIVEFASFLEKNGWTIFSNGTTAEILKENNISFKIEHAFDNSPRNINESSQLIQRILHTRVANSGSPFDTPDNENNYFIICINFDPLQGHIEYIPKVATGSSGLTSYRATLTRDSSINFFNVLILTDPYDYKECLIELRIDDIQQSFRTYLAGKALNLVSAYDSANAFAINENNPFSSHSYLNYLTMPYKKTMVLDKAMNPTQNSIVYQLGSDGGSIQGFKMINMEKPSHTVLADSSYAWDQICMLYENLKVTSAIKSENCEGYPYTTQFTPLTGTVYSILIKFRTIVGAGIDTNVSDSFKKTLGYDLDSTVNSTLGCSSVIDSEAAQEIVKYNFNAIIAPGFTDDAKEIFSSLKNTCLIAATRPATSVFSALILDGGVIVSNIYRKLFERWVVPTKTRPTQKQCDELAFGMCLAKSANSYASVCIKDYAMVGFASNYTSRFKALGSALYEAKQSFILHPTDDNIIADVLISDTALVLCEPIKELIDNGLQAIIQTGGDPGDQDFIDYCDAHNVAMVFTGITQINY